MQRKFYRVSVTCLGLLAVIITVVYVYVSYVDPYRAVKRLEKLSAVMLAPIYGCLNQDEECLEVIKNHEKFEELHTESKQMFAPVENIIKNPDYVTLLKHSDGSFCFLTHEPNQDLSDSELQEWLDKYGEKKYIEMIRPLMLGKDLFESIYHKPNPMEVMAHAAETLKRKERVFSQRWADLNLTQRFYEWSPDPKKTREVPASIQNEILQTLREFGVYFDQSRIIRMHNLAKVTLTKERLSEIVSALEQFSTDFGTAPMESADGYVELGALVSIE